MNILWGNFYSRSLFFLIYITASSLNVDDDGTANQVSNKCQTIKSSLDALGVSLSAVAMKWDTKLQHQPAGAAGEDWAKVEKQQQLNEWHGNV